ncbi:MAG: potassium transporter TrkH [Sandaracinus sp.]|nr:potassium transporter TrkH [Sandaracinus sp.]
MAAQDHPARAHRLARSYALLAGTPAVFLLGGALPTGDEGFELPVRVGAVCLFALGAWLLPARWTHGAALITFALLATVGAHALALRTRPDLVVFALAAVVAVMLTTLTAPSEIGRRPPDWRPPVVHTLALASLAGWFVVVALERDAWPELGVALATTVAACVGTVVWIQRERRKRRYVGVALLALSAVLLGFAQGLPGLLSAALPASLATLALVRGNDGSWVREAAASVLEHPPRMLVVTFLVLCVGGALLLSLPVATENGEAIGLVDAAFTAVSAVCVTGLATVDTPTTFSPFGEGVLLLLIQVGGLGIMTFYTAALAALGQRLSLRHESTIAASINVRERQQLLRTLAQLIGFTFVVEIVGGALLTLAFAMRGEPILSALWRGLFTSISAFCNAGFALQSDSLVGYQDDAFVLHVVAVVIVLGGLSPAAALALPSLVRRRPVALQIKLGLATSVALLLVGFVLYGFLEWDASLAELAPLDRVHNAWFQSVTLRTAGFNSVDLATTRPATQTMMIAWMFVGGSPGGTAGGAKTTTAALLVLMVVAAMRGRTYVDVFGRRIPHATVYRAAAVFTVGVLSAIGLLAGLQLTQSMDLGVAVFEAVSALATVGLSIGGTAQLDEVGKVLIMFAMFAGRVGPLTLFLFLSEQKGDELWKHPEEEVDVG